MVYFVNMGLIGIKFRAYPSSEQKQTLSQWIGCARFIYNAKCDEDKYFRTLLKKSLSLTGEQVPVDQSYSQFKTEQTGWLDDCPSQILRNSAVNWYHAYQRFFQGLGGRPQHKAKGKKDSIYLTSELFSFDEPYVELPKTKCQYVPPLIVLLLDLGRSLHTFFRGHRDHRRREMLVQECRREISMCEIVPNYRSPVSGTDPNQENAC